MSSAPILHSVRPEVYRAKTFTAFRVREDHTQAVPISAATMKDALDAATVRYCVHKDRLVIREDDGGAVKLHVYAIRKGKAKWVYIDYQQRRVEDLRAELICTIDAAVLS